MHSPIVRGLAAGLIAGLLAGLFAYVVAEPSVDAAIAIEEAAAEAATSDTERPERARRAFRIRSRTLTCRTPGRRDNERKG